MKTYLENVRTWGGFRGKAELIEYLEGKTVSRAEAMLAFCYACGAGYNDGAKDCEMADTCPMYPYMPYGTKKPVSGRAGKVLSEEQKAKMQAGRKKSREKPA